MFLVKCLKAIAKCCLNWFFFFSFHSALHCCVRYSTIEYQDEIFKSITKKVMADPGYECRFRDLKYFDVRSWGGH